MDPVANPFTPGAGTKPPELSGRDDIIKNADIALRRILKGKSAESQILLGLRGTGKTVLLRRFEEIAKKAGYETSFIEAPEDRKLAELLFPKIHAVLRGVSGIAKARHYVELALGALRSFSLNLNKSGDISLTVDPLRGVADSGNLEFDLTDLFEKMGEALKQADKGWALFIDEVQYLSREDLSALIVAIHTANQKNLPIVFFGAGLPQVAALAGDAKSYAERLFDYQPIDQLSKEASFRAIKEPIEKEGEKIDQDALERIFKHTKGYPYFLQQWGQHTWHVAEQSPVTVDDVERATPQARQNLDESFFNVRFDRLTPKEKKYVFAMAALGEGPYRSVNVAERMEEELQRLGPIRASIIKKGMIYSPRHGDIDFTVPMFDSFLMRIKQNP